MKVFLSYASPHKDLVRPVCTTLRASGFAVFFDDSDLPRGDTYDDRIHEAIGACDLFVFMLSPQAVEPGRYTLTELLFVEQRWPNPAGRVLAVLPLDTPEPRLPAYLRPLTLQKQVGNLAAEVLATLRRMAQTLPVRSPVPAQAAAVGAAPATAGFASLDLHFAAGAPRGYTLRLDGAAHADAAALPDDADPEAIEQSLWQDAREFADTARRDASGAALLARLPSPEGVRRVGARLHGWLFSPGLREVLREPLRRIDRQRGQGLRFVINTTDAPALARLPWEFAYDTQRQDFVFTDPMKPLVRWLDVDEALPTLEVQPPLRLLIAVAAPRDQPALAVGDELARLDRALADLHDEGLLQTALIRHTSVARLDRQLLEFAPHVLHFVGHGDFDGDEGRLLLEADSGALDDEDTAGDTTPLSGRRLAVLLRNHLQTLRLVYLNSCLGATASRRDPFGGVAQALVGHGVPAVIAMQFPIPDRSAATLAHDFYRYLASGRPVDEALTAVRALMVARGDEVEWGAPVLTMRTPDGRLFDVAATAPAAPATKPSRPAPTLERPPMPAPLTEPAAPTKPLDVPARSSSSRWALAGLALLIGGTLLAWWLLRPQAGVEPPPTPAIAPPPEPVVVPTPAPVLVPPPLPDPQAAAAAAWRDAIAQARARLDAGDVAGALDALERAQQSAPALRLWTMPPDLRNESEALLERLAFEERQGPDALARVLELERAIGGRRLEEAVRGMAMQSGGVLPPPPKLAPPPPSAFVPPPEASSSQVPGRFEHRVRRGDTLWSIARLRYGDPWRWPEIHAANRWQLPDPSRIEPGQRLHIPPHPSTEAASTHVVQPGESLWRIAARLYGNGELWPRIRAANADRLPDPDRIAPGMTLKIPAAR